MSKPKFELHDVHIGRRTWGQAIQQLPRSHHKAPNFVLQSEYRLIESAFPGRDGIGADVYERVGDAIFNYAALEPHLMAQYSVQLSKMRLDDPILYAQTHRGIVLEVLPKSKVRVKFTDSFLIPNVMDVEASHLEWYLEDGSTIPFTTLVFRCPKCDVPWKVKAGFTFNHYDCPVCGEKRDQYVG